ncbi:Y4yA family PLP-dependent enzyme [Streptomyces sp. NPDC004609]|uniref:Y4yA family PLP-dependent enzyme n=1 Tax=Streptomyces sp. NPDC004609 TaxID=3364704 RepID=UPI00367651E6
MAVSASHWPTLPGRPDPAMDAVLASGLAEELAHALGGPFHILLPDAFEARLRELRAVLRESGVNGFFHYAKKANKAAVWMESCARLGAGADVASLGEFREALGHGIRGEDIVVTGPAKSAGLLRLAVRHGALVSVDTVGELRALISLAEADSAGSEPARPARVLLRVLPPGRPYSRFGMNDAELAAALDHCARAGEPERARGSVRMDGTARARARGTAAGSARTADEARAEGSAGTAGSAHSGGSDRVKGPVRMEGFGFHLSGYAIQPRADLAARLAELCLTARAMGLRADRVDIGGGLPVNYTDADSWSRFLRDQHGGHYHAEKSFAADDFYPYHSPVAGADALRALLDARPEGFEGSLAEVLRDRGVTLLAEPGRALLDGAGATVFPVQGVKERDGYRILTVDGTSLSLSEQWFNSEYLPDPRLLSRDPGAPDGIYPSCVGGASCLESDMLTWRKIPFRRLPRPGDLLVYPNTAGYQMDSNESPFHELPLPPKVVVDRTERSRPRWRLDRPPG